MHRSTKKNGQVEVLTRVGGWTRRVGLPDAQERNVGECEGHVEVALTGQKALQKSPNRNNSALSASQKVGTVDGQNEAFHLLPSECLWTDKFAKGSTQILIMFL